MYSIRHQLLLTLMAVLLVCAPLLAVAGDEDLSSSVYLVFDPDTGDFVQVNDPNRVKQDHAAQDPADAALAKSVHASANAGDAGGAADSSDSNAATTGGLVAGVVVLLLVGVGFAARRRRRGQGTA